MSDAGWNVGPNWKDAADKSWLRTAREPFIVRALAFMYRMLILLLIATALALVVAHNEARAEGVLFEPSAWPIGYDEALRTRPDLGRPLNCVSLQQRTGEPWHHRTCWYGAACRP